MTHLIVVLAATALGVEAGWTPLPDGGHQYTIQIEPALVSQLRDGNDLISEVPPHVDVRRFRITVGSGAVARIDGPQPDNVAQPAPPADAPEEPAVEPPAENFFAGPPADNDPLGETPPADPFDNALTVPAMPDETTEQPDTVPPEATASPAADTPSDAMPANFDADGADAQPLAVAEPASDPVEASTPPRGGDDSAGASEPSDAKGQAHSAEKPRLEGDVVPGEKPWMPFAIAAVLLALSLGANFYLGWIAWDWRGRYLQSLNKHRAATSA